MSDAAVPDVSVVVGAYNAMPYLTRCIRSVVDQTLGRDRIELIAVNDGSTDGTGEELDRMAEEFPSVVRVIHQENSGGPSAPRNVGIEQARGRFIFFLDADDYLGEEALQRMVSMADANSSDVVLGKMVGVGGRGAPKSMFKRNQPKTDVFSSAVYWTLNPLKLFRRDLIERLGLRFRTDMRTGEDQPFVSMAYLHARAISVVADYDCYYWVEREDGNNVTRTTRGTHPRIKYLRVMMELLAREVKSSTKRDILLRRHFDVDIKSALRHLLRETEPEIRDSALAEIQQLITANLTEELTERYPAVHRLRLHLARHGMLEELREVTRFDQARKRGKVVVEKGRAYAAYPYFRDIGRAVPDHCYDITRELTVRHHLDVAEMDGSELELSGHAYIHTVDTVDTAIEAVLRERDSGVEYSFPAENLAAPSVSEEAGEGMYDYGQSGFRVRIDTLTAADGQVLPSGLWDLHMRVRSQGIVKEGRTGNKRSDGIDSEARPRLVHTPDGASHVVTPYYTKPYGNFTLDVGQRKHRLQSHVKVDRAAWAEDAPGTVVISGHVNAGVSPGDLVVRATSVERTVDLAAFQTGEVTSPGPFEFRVSLARAFADKALPAGVWELAVCLSSPDLAATVWVPNTPGLTTSRFRRRGLPAYAKPLDKRQVFSVRLALVDPVAGLRRRLGIGV
ncbi:glycosyltransferase [Streptomyces sp. NPDC020141]|uniref:glycosyltransferase n=1 Tax=Streptomyces sp. NPDC020141 TaxID=3365065 RepID=UPI003790D217